MNEFIDNLQSPHLAHEVGYHPVKDGIAESEAPLPGAQSPEVCGRLGDDVWEELNGDVAQNLSVGCHRQEHPRVAVSRVLQDSGHLRRRGVRGVAAAALAHAALARAERLLERLGYLGCFELGSELFHDAVAVWGRKDKLLENTASFRQIHQTRLSLLGLDDKSILIRSPIFQSRRCLKKGKSDKRSTSRILQCCAPPGYHSLRPTLWK